MTQLKPQCTAGQSVQYGAQHGGDHHDVQRPLYGGGVHGGGPPARGPVCTGRERTEWFRSGGKYRPTSVSDVNQTHIQAEEAELDFARAARGCLGEVPYW